jgi:DNA topoisomerase VI subunit A
MSVIGRFYNLFKCRDIYYKDVPLFQKQVVVDRVSLYLVIEPVHLLTMVRIQLIDDLAATFELERSDLNVVSLLFPDRFPPLTILRGPARDF